MGWVEGTSGYLSCIFSGIFLSTDNYAAYWFCLPSNNKHKIWTCFTLVLGEQEQDILLPA